MLQRTLLLAATAALLLSACSRQTEVVLDVDLLSFAGDDRTSVLSLSALAESELYLGGDGDGESPDGGLLVDVSDALGGTIADALQRFALRIGFEVAPSADVDVLRIALYLADADVGTDIYRDDYLWAEAEILDVAADTSAAATLSVEALAGDVAASLLFEGRFRLGLLVVVQSAAAEAGDEVTLTWTEGALTLVATPGGLLP